MTQPADVEWTPTPERQELGEAIRRLLDAVVRTGADAADMAAATAAIDAVTESLASRTVRADRSVSAGSYRAHMSLVGGLSHPIAPELLMDVHEGGAEGEVVVGPRFQGGPGLVHGGILALLIDHAMGCVAASPERPAMTARLTLHYRRPTPLDVPLAVAVRLDKIEGRKLHLKASIKAHGKVTVEADAIFLTLTPDNLQTVFGNPA